MPPLTERDAWVIVASANQVGPATMEKLLREFGSASGVLDAVTDRTARGRLAPLLGRRGEPAFDGLVEAACDARGIVSRLAGSRVRVVTLEDDDYPPKLRSASLAPPVLFVDGSIEVLSQAPAVAVVGTRKPTEAGRRTAARIGGALVGAGSIIVSGLAVGIDGAAHAAAIEAGGQTIAVLGGGIDRLFPQAHRRLAAEIVERGGAVVSEFLPWIDPLPASFPRRNRIISGLASATVVVEAGRRSGALSTAKWSLDQGRGCFLVPGSLDAPASVGCLAFLREHPDAARIVAGIPELLVDLDLGAAGETRGATATGRRIGAALAEGGPVEREVGRLIAAGVATVDELVAATELPVATVLAAITLLEGRGLVVDALGRYRPAGSLGTAAPRPVRRRSGGAVAEMRRASRTKERQILPAGRC
ncbi:MAG TPA: DNA-processing protein DprA [Candidatus Limnocylindrales bacterium]|nr:DNA-processing protein DprA [Candidatus Limnocylindrales bacterium]